jgi:hypothetical protein
VYVPVARPVIVVLVPVPVVVAPPGVLVNVQVPVAGKPLITTLPVDTVQVGWETEPMTGAEGSGNTVTITASVEAHCPLAFVTVSVYVVVVEGEAIGFAIFV